MKMRQVLSWVGHRIREGLLYLRYSVKSSVGKKLIFFPSNPIDGGSSQFRAWELAAALEKLGWNCTVVPAQLEYSQRLRLIKILKPDFAFIQQGRHPLNRHDMLCDIPYFFDIDDAYYLQPEYSEIFQNLCSNARGVIASSQNIASWCKNYNSNVTVIWTGAKCPSTFPSPSPAKRRPILVWTHHFIPNVNEYEREFFADILRYVRKLVKFEVWIIGVKQNANLETIHRICAEEKIVMRHWPFLSYPKMLKLLSNASVGIDIIDKGSAYNQAKSFGKVLAYMRTGTPVVATNTAEYPHFFKNGINGFLVNSLDEWVDAIANLLLDGDLRERIARSAWEDFRKQLSIENLSKKVDTFLR